MKKFLSVLALSGLLVACNNEKKEEKKIEESNTTTPVKADPAATDNVSSSNPDVPTFSDPEVQKFANDYATFIKEYRAGIKDPARMKTLTDNMQQWSTRGQSIGMKLANNPAEAQKWAQWWLAVTKDLYPSTSK